MVKAWRVPRAAAGVVVMVAAIGAGEAGDRPEAWAQTGSTAILAGQAVDAVTGAPVAHTLIGLSQRARSGPNTTPTAPNTQLVTVMADSNGRFVVRDVPRGSFLLLATAPGYIVSNYGQARATGPTRTIDLNGDERVVNLKVPLWRHAVISGTVSDESGEPVVGASVRVLRRVANGPGGQTRYMPGTQTTTDDRGQYRLTALTPGQFIVTVPQTQVTVPAAVVDAYLQSPASRGTSSNDLDDVLEAMSSRSAVPSPAGGLRIDDLLLQSSGMGRLVTVPPPTADSVFVYPTASYAIAGRDRPAELTVGPGEERSGVDIQLTPARAVRVTGTVTLDGAPLAGVVVRLTNAAGHTLQAENGYEAAATVTTANGTFTLLGVTRGTYLLKVLRAAAVTLPPALTSNPAIAVAYASPPAAAGATTPLVGAQVPLTIGDSDIRDLVVPLRAGATVSGQAVFRGTAPTPKQLQSFAVLLTSEDGGLPGSGLQIVRLNDSGGFRLTAPAPGRYMVTIVGAPAAGWRAEEILLRGQPVTAPLDLSGDAIDGLSLVYTTEVGEIAGTAERPTGAPVTTAGIAVFSTDRRLWIQEPLNPRQPRIEQTARGGAFSVAGLLPGEYFVVALDDVDVPDTPTEEFFAAAAKVATRATVTANHTSTHTLTIRSWR